MPNVTRTLEIIPLGGLGEFGMNSMVYRSGEDAIIVDAGMMFPGAEHFGIEVVIPDLAFLEECKRLHGVVVTHGHEDHIGALPYLVARHNIPIHGTPHTLALVRHRLREHALDGVELVPLPEHGPLRLGPFTIEALEVAHSIPQARLLVLHTPAGVVVHTADFKLDADPPDGVRLDLARIAQLGRDGVRVLLSDSTNADQPGTTPGERSVADGLETLISRAAGRVLVTTFSSHITRLQALARIADRHGRRLALVGSSLQHHVEIAETLGSLQIPPQSRIPAEAVASRARRAVLVVAAGSQGEPLSAMARIAVGRHRDIDVSEGDLFIHSARTIPSNTKLVGRMIDHLLRRGADIVTAADATVHASGHASRDELRQLLELLRPRHFIPIHGEYRQLHAHARLARETGIAAENIVLAESGDQILVDEEGLRKVGRVRVGQIFLDATWDPVDGTVLRERRRIAEDGVVIPVIAVDRRSGVLSGYPQISCRGLAGEGDSLSGLLDDARQVLAQLVADATIEERADETLLRAKIQSELRRFFRRRLQRQPLILPVIVEL